MRKILLKLMMIVCQNSKIQESAHAGETHKTVAEVFEVGVFSGGCVARQLVRC